MKFELVNRTRRPLPRVFLNSLLRKIIRELRRKRLWQNSKHLLIAMVTPKEMASLNQKYRRKAYPTDVLSFMATEPRSLGELVVCPQVIKGQAREHGLSYDEELSYMILHGVLHLLGFEHEKSRAQANRMFQLQDEIFDALSKPGKPARK